jgi:hypothetical protein
MLKGGIWPQLQVKMDLIIGLNFTGTSINLFMHIKLYIKNKEKRATEKVVF